MNDTNETPSASDIPDPSSNAATKPKRKGVSLPFLIIVALLSVGGYFGVKQIMYSSMLNEMKQEVDKEVKVDPNLPGRNSKVSM